MENSKRTSCRSRMLNSMADNSEYPVTNETVLAMMIAPNAGREWTCSE
jgi:hypothetical protein